MDQTGHQEAAHVASPSVSPSTGAQYFRWNACSCQWPQCESPLVGAIEQTAKFLSAPELFTVLKDYI